MKRNTRRCHQFIAACLIVLACGCRLDDMFTPERVSDPRGVPIGLHEVPDAVMKSFRTRFPEDSEPAVERCDAGSSYRFETTSGSILHFSKDGEFGGMII